MPKQTFTSSGTFIIPAGITSIIVECWGGGGMGGENYYDGAGGGGGGSYAKKTLTVTPGTSHTVTVGAGGGFPNPQNGGDSWFSTSATVLAKGGTAGSEFISGGNPQMGSIGDITYFGGVGADGGSGETSSGLGSYGGGGGGGAGSTGGGGNGYTYFAGGGAAINGGNGGNGNRYNWFYGNASGSAGKSYGGGGGGISGIDGTSTGGDTTGGTGAVIITYGSNGNSNFLEFF